jgi:hypothetical protein
MRVVGAAQWFIPVIFGGCRAVRLLHFAAALRPDAVARKAQCPGGPRRCTPRTKSHDLLGPCRATQLLHFAVTRLLQLLMLKRQSGLFGKGCRFMMGDNQLCRLCVERSLDLGLWRAQEAN